MESNENALNPAKGQRFQRLAAGALSAHFGRTLLMDIPIAIGSPPKEHRFDLVSEDKLLVGECKNYSWTKGGNVPSAKMGLINEAVFYLSFVPAETVRFVVMRRHLHPGRDNSLAEYYYRTYKHLLGRTRIFELGVEDGNLREVST